MNCSQKKALQLCWVEFIAREIGEPDYAFSFTLKPVFGPRRWSTKLVDAEQALHWFLHVLNTRCFGHAHRRKGLELGIVAAIEGLLPNQEPHWHGIIRLPRLLAHEKFHKALNAALKATRRFGRQFKVTPYVRGTWELYISKTGSDSFCPDFFRKGTP